MGSEVKVPGNLEKTFAEDEKASIVVEPSKLKPKMHPKKLIITNSEKDISTSVESTNFGANSFGTCIFYHCVPRRSFPKAQAA